MAEIIIAFLAGVGLAGFIALILNINKRLKDLEARGAKPHSCEAIGGRRHTHNTLNGIGDAQALLVHQVLLGELEKQRNLALVKQTLKILGQLSEGPYSYQDGAGKRDEIMRQAVQDFIKSLDEEMK